MSDIIQDNITDDMEEYRNTIMTNMITSQKLVKLVGGELDQETGFATDLIWTNFIPQQYLPNTVTTEEAFIFYDIETDSDIRKDTYKNVVIYFWIVVHKRINRYKDGSGLLNDKIVWELKKIFKNNNILGIGKIHEVYNRLFDTKNDNFTGRILGLRITDWSDTVKR